MHGCAHIASTLMLFQPQKTVNRRVFIASVRNTLILGLARPRALHCVELFAGAGGLAIAGSKAGFEHDTVLEYNHDACETIRANQR